MQWAPQQMAALKAVHEWLQNPDQQCFRLFGYAGTGKTTLAKHFAEGLDGTAVFGAYTGKAAHVLRQKGCVGASTLHSLIYHPKDKGKARLLELEKMLLDLLAELQGMDIDNDKRVKQLRSQIEAERQSLARPAFTLNHESIVSGAPLIIIDECSMVDGQMGEDLLSFGTPILVLGDPAQLPPVAGAGFFTEGHTPDVMLTDIHRQARDNPIIEMATRVRNKESLKPGLYGESRVVAMGKRIPPDEVLEKDQILVGRNKTRHASNRRVRALLGREGNLPVDTDRLVCLKNNHDKGLLNGAIWYVEGGTERIDLDKMYLTVYPEDEGGCKQTVEVHSHHFEGRSEELTWWERKEAEEFDYGYALTVHKSQGSQFDDVLLFDESSAFRADKWRWLYTGITRAAKKVTVVEI